MNSENLIPNSARTPKERQELAKKAGKKSGEARAKRKTFKELFQAALSAQSEDGLTQQEKIVLKAIEVAKTTGNYRDIEATIGEKPRDKIDATINSDNKEIIKSYLEAIKNGRSKTD